MQSREIPLCQSTIDNGRIYFPIGDAKFFPANALADREGDGHKGEPVYFISAEFRIQSDIRVISSNRISPRRTFAPYLKSVSASVGDMLRIVKVGEREFSVELIASKVRLD